jgi:hypothetical protein
VLRLGARRAPRRGRSSRTGIGYEVDAGGASFHFRARSLGWNGGCRRAAEDSRGLAGISPTLYVSPWPCCRCNQQRRVRRLPRGYLPILGSGAHATVLRRSTALALLHDSLPVFPPVPPAGSSRIDFLLACRSRGYDEWRCSPPEGSAGPSVTEGSIGASPTSSRGGIFQSGGLPAHPSGGCSVACERPVPRQSLARRRRRASPNVRPTAKNSSYDADEQHRSPNLSSMSTPSSSCSSRRPSSRFTTASEASSVRRSSTLLFPKSERAAGASFESRSKRKQNRNKSTWTSAPHLHRCTFRAPVSCPRPTR